MQDMRRAWYCEDGTNVQTRDGL